MKSLNIQSNLSIKCSTCLWNFPITDYLHQYDFLPSNEVKKQPNLKTKPSPNLQRSVMNQWSLTVHLLKMTRQSSNPFMFHTKQNRMRPVTGLYPLSVLHLVSIATINTTTLLSVKLKLNKWTQTRKKQIKIRYENLNKRFNFYLQFQCSFTENQFSFTQQRKHNWRNGHNIHTACKSKCIKWLGELSHKLKS